MKAPHRPGDLARRWLPMLCGSSAMAIIAAMVWVALQTSPRLPPPAGEEPVVAPVTTELEGLHLCHESAAAFDTCWRESAPRARHAPRQGPAVARQAHPRVRVIRMLLVLPSGADDAL